MVNVVNTLRLLAMPILWMGIVQFIFGVLALTVFRDGVAGEFFWPAIGIILLAAFLFYVLKAIDLNRIYFRDALLFATLTWVITGLLGSLPIMLVTDVSFTDAVFESTSALTTTGATILTGLDDMPKSFLLYRQFLQWMGGLGVVIFVVAVLPMLNAGGMRLLKAETPGPMKDDKLSPRVAHTAHYLWLIYLLITFLCAISYFLGGMTAYDAIAHSFTTVSTGGFSTHDASMWFYESHLLLNISNVFMLAGAISFALHFRVIRANAPGQYLRDEETRVFLGLVLGLSVIMAVYLFVQSRYPNSFEAISFATFHVISFITSTGYGAADLSSWPAATALFLVFCSYLGGCAGSTAGGNKIVRNIIAFKLIRREMTQLIHPRAVLTVKYQKSPVESRVAAAVMGFLSFAAASTLILTLMMMATGLDFWTAFTAVVACINVLGPGFGEVGSHFQIVSDTGSWILSGAMILGRLEYFTVLALFSRAFWQQ